jgi:hypothetical protein
MDIIVKHLHPHDRELMNDIRLLAAERGCRMVAAFEFGKYEQEHAYTILVDNTPTYFTHSHKVYIEGVPYYRVASKAAQLGKHLPLIVPGTIPGRYKAGEMYLCGYHQTHHANGLPCILTATLEKDDDSPDSHRVFRQCARGHMFTVGPDYIVHVLHKKRQAIFNIDCDKARFAYNEIVKYNHVTFIDN